MSMRWSFSHSAAAIVIAASSLVYYFVSHQCFVLNDTEIGSNS